MFYCGIDLSSKTTALCVVNEQDKVVCEREVATDPDRIARHLQPFRGVRCLVEAAPMAEWCKRGLEARGIECRIIDTRRAQKLFESRKKTDRRDARTLARMARVQWYNEVHAKSEAARLMRTRLGIRKAVVGVVVSLQNQVRGFLRAHGERVTAPKGPRFAQRIREQVSEQAQLLAVVEPLLRAWESTWRELTAEDRALKRLARGIPEVKRLMGVPGVGPIVGLTFVASGVAMQVRQLLAHLHFNPFVNFAAAAFVAVWYIRVARGTLLTVTDEGFTWFVPGAPLSGGGEQKVSVVWSEVRRLRLRTLRSYRYQTFALTVETDQGTVDLDLVRLRGDGLVARKRREGIAAFATHRVVERFAEATGLAVERGA